MGNTSAQSAQAHEQQQQRSDSNSFKGLHKNFCSPLRAEQGLDASTCRAGSACEGIFCGVMDEMVCDDGHGQAPQMWDELAPVTLNVYNVGTSLQIRTLNGVLRRVGTGLFHCGVEVFGTEWSYSVVMGEECGIFCCQPCHCDGHTHVESIYMGRTTLTATTFQTVINSMEMRWSSEAYNMYTHNCCHFCDRLCVSLGVGNIPHWINHLANTCAMVTIKPSESEACQKCFAAISNPETLLCCSDEERPVLFCSSASGQDIPGSFTTMVTREGSFEE